METRQYTSTLVSNDIQLNQVVMRTHFILIAALVSVVKGDLYDEDFMNTNFTTSAQLYRGGIKIWLYLRKIIPGEMTLSFYTLVNRATPAQPECDFSISLKFTGWRAVWVSFQECKLRRSMSPLYLMRIQAPFWHAGVIYFDLLHILRKNMEIRLIKTRLRDWYRVKGQSTYELTGYHRTRWFRLRTKIKRARGYLQTLNITKTKDGFIKGTPLFSRNSEYGQLSISAPDIKFGFMFRDVLLPLAFEYYFASRKEEIHKTIEIKLSKLNHPNTERATVEKLVGFDKELMNIFYDKYKLGIRTLTKYKLRKALREINHKRFLRIKRIFEYIIDQGWAVGSALGSLDHEMIRSSKGFVTSIFLLHQQLRRSSLLLQLIDITKWYLEFGELYQKPFESVGTTADRLRTLFLYRLMCVLVMPEATLQEALDKMRDMRALTAWYENALSINPALGGTIKPDYTGYHHQSFYPNDYVLPGLLTASHVVYILRGTEYEVSETSRDNLRNAIHFMRLLSEQYIIPNSVTNASPTIVLWEDSQDLIPHKTRSQYQHIGSLPHRTNEIEDTSTHHARSPLHNESIRAFLRMFNESNRDVHAYLKRGKWCSWKSSYMYTLGSLSLLYELKQRAMDLGIDAEPAPQGNWAKNFAALSIHRRQGWVVTVKGFNNFIWGHESSHRGNEYGRYQSYGQLLIANTDYGLKAHDIDRGWDWTRLPGTTTLRMPVEQLRDKETRFYNPKSLCGAMHFQGTSQFRNGVFTMDFERPGYSDRAAEFWFKKSVFFFDNLLVCLGSDIKAKRFSFRPAEVETTLFQNIGRQQHARRFIWSINSPGKTTRDTTDRYGWRLSPDERGTFRQSAITFESRHNERVNSGDRITQNGTKGISMIYPEIRSLNDYSMEILQVLKIWRYTLPVPILQDALELRAQNSAGNDRWNLQGRRNDVKGYMGMSSQKRCPGNKKYNTRCIWIYALERFSSALGVMGILCTDVHGVRLCISLFTKLLFPNTYGGTSRHSCLAMFSVLAFAQDTALLPNEVTVGGPTDPLMCIQIFNNKSQTLYFSVLITTQADMTNRGILANKSHAASL
ncbi:Chondroitin sulfate ABC exolyase, partial [Paramuricea clavata]